MDFVKNVQLNNLHITKIFSQMLFFLFKVIAAGLIVAFSSWLAGQNPKLAGFIIALPLVSLIAILFSYYEHNDTEKTVMFTKSIFIAGYKK